MKWFLFSLVILYSCGGNFSASLSQDQKGLFTLCNDFSKDYKAATDAITREKLVSDYEMKLQKYLTYTCDSSLKNIKVRMTRLDEYPTGKIQAEFKDEYCSYVFRQQYDSSNQMKADILYRFVKSLEQEKEITLRFLYGGNVKINAPENTSFQNFEIEVIPMAIAG